MNKYNILIFSVTLVSVLMVSCGLHNTTAIQTTPEIFSGQELETLMPTRKSESDGSLNLSVTILNVKISENQNDIQDPHIITIDIVFTNMSDHSIVFKKPRSTGFTGQGLLGFPVVFNDVGIVIQRKDEMVMDVSPSSQFSVEPPARDSLETFFYHRPADFVTLESGETFSYAFTSALPIVRFEGEKSGTNLLPGVYTLFLGYGNDFIGYQLPIDATPPVSLHYFSDPSTLT